MTKKIIPLLIVALGLLWLGFNFFAPTLNVATVPTPALCSIRGALPDPACTPGVIYPTITKETVCDDAWVSMLHIPDVQLTVWQRAVAYDYGITVFDPKQYEGDWLVPLSLGGAVTLRNLWNQPIYAIPYSNNADKNAVEHAVRERVCTGQMTLAQAQNGMASDWTQYLNLITPTDVAVGEVGK